MAKCHFNKLQIFQNKALKMILDLPWHTSTTLIHETSEIDMIKTYIEYLINRFNERQIQQQNL